MANRADFERLAPWSRDDVADSLRRARGNRGATLSEAARATCIPAQYLEALEDDAPLDAFPAPAYARFFLREYAQYLRLDDDALVDAFVERHGTGFGEESLADEIVKPLVSPPSRRVPRVLAVLAALALIVGVLLFARQRNTPAPAPDLPSSSAQMEQGVGAEEGATASANEAGPGGGGQAREGVRAELTLEQESWVRATAGSGDELIARVLPAGSTKHIRARHRLDIRMGNAGGVGLVVNGQHVRTGFAGQVVDLTLVWRGDGLHVQRVPGSVSV